MFSRIWTSVIPKVIRTRLPTVPAISSMMPYSSLVRQQFPALRNLAPQGFQPAPAFTMTVRNLNRNARRPKKANHGKRPCSHARRRARIGAIESRAHKKKIFGFWS